MNSDTPLDSFQEVLDRVAQTGQREEIDHLRVPDVHVWGGLDGKGCTVSVEHGRWWVVPPTAPGSQQSAA